MSEIAKFKLNLKTGEIEVEGSEVFVERQIQTLEKLVDLMKLSTLADKTNNLLPNVVQNRDDDKLGNSDIAGDDIPATFGEWLHTFKTDINDLDKVLITARFIQSKSSLNDFKTAEVNNALKEHGFKLSNPASALKNLVDKKLMFQTRKVGVLRFLRLSVDGQNHLNKLKRQD